VKNRAGGERDLMTAADALPPSLIHQFIRSPMSASGQMKPSGQRQAARYSLQASSVAKSV
jgi:hypothetical protein